MTELPPPDSTLDKIMGLVDEYADAFHGACIPGGGISFADGLVAKIKKDEIRKALAACVAAEREACAAICGQRSADYWHDYKDPASPFRGDARTEAMSDEAEQCEQAIRARNP
jgi:hypothetical protein